LAVALLNKPVGGGEKTSRKISRGHLPTKRSINLAGVGEKSINLKIAIPAIILIVAAAALLSKFAVVDRLIAQSEAEHEVAVLQSQVDAGYARIDSFGELVETYAHYTYSGMTREEVERTDRIAVIEMIQRDVLPSALVGAWSITGNQLTISIIGNTLQEINLIAQKLEQEELVDYCTVTTASTNSLYSYNGYYVGYYSYYGYQLREGVDSVTAQVTIYLKSATEVIGE